MKNNILVLVFIIIISSCKYRNSNFYFHTKIVETVNVDSGSLFVFKDSITSKLDSFWVTKNERKINYIHSDDIRKETKQIETITYNLEKRKTINDTSYQTIDIKASAYSNQIYFYYNSIPTPLTKYKNYNARIYGEPFLNDISFDQYYNSSNSDSVNIYNAYLLQGNNYQTVFENQLYSENSTDQTFVKINTLYSFSGGLMKFSILQDSVKVVKELVYSTIIRKKY